MPHFIIDCSENILKSHSQDEIIINNSMQGGTKCQVVKIYP